MNRKWLVLLSFLLGVAVMVVIAGSPPSGPHDAKFFNTKPLSKVVPGAGEDNFVYVWDNALDSHMLEAQAGGGGGLSFFTEADDNDTSVFTATGPNTTVGFNDLLTMQNNSIIGVDSIDADNYQDGSITFGDIDASITLGVVPVRWTRLDKFCCSNGGSRLQSEVRGRQSVQDGSDYFISDAKRRYRR